MRVVFAIMWHSANPDVIGCRGRGVFFVGGGGGGGGGPGPLALSIRYDNMEIKPRLCPRHLHLQLLPPPPRTLATPLNVRVILMMEIVYTDDGDSLY